MSNTDYKYDENPVTISEFFYRKFTVNDIWCEVEHDGEGGLWFHSGNSIAGQPTPESKPIYFSSEAQFMEFCTKLTGIDRRAVVFDEDVP